MKKHILDCNYKAAGKLASMFNINWDYDRSDQNYWPHNNEYLNGTIGPYKVRLRVSLYGQPWLYYDNSDNTVCTQAIFEYPDTGTHKRFVDGWFKFLYKVLSDDKVNVHTHMIISKYLLEVI